MTNNSSCQTQCCVACGRELEFCECEAGLHIYGDQHNITWEDNCPDNCPAFKFENGKYVKKTDGELEQTYRNKQSGEKDE